jgi:hypothetical protein
VKLSDGAALFSWLSALNGDAMMKDWRKSAVYSSMKTILIIVSLAFAFSGGACSRSDKPETATQATPNQNLRADAERLQRATAKAAEERRRAQAQESPTPGAP